MQKTIGTLSLLVLASLAAQAQQTAPAAAPLSPTEEWIKKVKNPVPWFSWGGDLRLRNEYFDNAVTLNKNAAGHENDYFRFRARVWQSFKPVTDLSLNVRITAEPRYVERPKTSQGMAWRDGVVDNLNLKWANPDGLPMTMTIGRQDIYLGDPLNWWLVADGTPGDGSRTFFFDAARLTIDLKEQKTTVDAIYINQGAWNDYRMPAISHHTTARHASFAQLTDQNEQGLILYVSNKSVAKTQIDGYFMYKQDRPVKDIVKKDDNADIYTLGTKITGDIGDHWKYSAEGAYQFGYRQADLRDVAGAKSQSINAFGVNSRLSYLFKDSMNNQLRMNYEYLSGNDPSTPNSNEAFDLLWGRWPRFSELYIYSFIAEPVVTTAGRVAQIGNLHRIGPGWSITPLKNLNFSLDYNAMFADQRRKTANATFDTGGFRGHYLQTVLKYKVSDHMSAHLWGEFIWSGDYYTGRDLFTFLRAEMLFTF